MPRRDLVFFAVLGMAVFVSGLINSGIDGDRVLRGVQNFTRFADEAWPPTTDRIGPIVHATFETFEMAVVGTFFGALASLPVAMLAASNTTPHPIVGRATRGIIAFIRSVPDIVWGLIFVVFMGLGSPAGIAALTIDAIGFCGRFFAERIEELDPKPTDALRATGSRRIGVVVAGVFPRSVPSFIATTLYALEGATRSAVVLGVVGAGGVGLELSTSLNLFRYDEALMIIIVVFAVVFTVERISARLRAVILR